MRIDDGRIIDEVLEREMAGAGWGEKIRTSAPAPHAETLRAVVLICKWQSQLSPKRSAVC
jgi:hypothetical protein